MTLDSFKMCAFDPTIVSIYAIAEQRPQLIKQAVDSLLDRTQSSESPEQAQTLLRTCFLYFFQLVGIEETDAKSLEILFGFLSAKNSNVGKQKELTKAQIGQISFNQDKIAFMGKNNRTQQAHVRTFKRFCKMLTTNLVDVFPAKKQHMLGLVREILNFSRCKVRLLRYGFTHIGLSIFS